MTTYGETILALERNAERAQEVEARAWQLYLQWREMAMDGGAYAEVKSLPEAMAQCFDEAEAWLKLAEERRQAKA